MVSAAWVVVVVLVKVCCTMGHRMVSRQAVLKGLATTTPLALPGVGVAGAVQQTRGQRAVGTPNAEGLDVDAALGIAWGGKERCDAADPRCGTNGAAVTNGEGGFDPPSLGQVKVSEVVEVVLSIAGQEATLRIGVFDVDAARVFADLARSEFQVDDSTPAGLVDGGLDWCIRPALVAFAATPAAQELAYRRRYDLRTTPDDFEPAKLAPDAEAVGADVPDKTQPGLLVAPASGPGPRLEFSLLAQPASPNPTHKVLGAVLDQDSMRVLSRLAAVPVVADRAALGGKACKPIIKLSVKRSTVYPPS